MIAAPLVTVPDPRRVAAGRKELHSRRTGRAGVGPCPNPGCVERDADGNVVLDADGNPVRHLVVLIVYVPKNRFDPSSRPQHRRTRRRGGTTGDAPRLVFDYRLEARSNEYANYATTSAYERARLLPDPDEVDSLLPPLADHEIRVCLHLARHPECEPYLTAPKP